MQTVLITGIAGFIGFSLAARLLRDGYSVIGVDNLNDYYDPSLKVARLNYLTDLGKNRANNLYFHKVDLVDYQRLSEIFTKYSPKHVVNLAAQAGVRYSLINPNAYIQSNVVGFSNVLECCRHNNVDHLVYASSSSVYGGNKSLPFAENQSVDHPVSLYAATKRSNELMAHTYSHLYGLPTTGLRFFTVYGPWGRPDMALFLFTKAILAKEAINIYNNGKMERDFTYIDDIVESILRLLSKSPPPNPEFDHRSPIPSQSSAPFRLFNIGNSSPTSLMSYINAIEKELNMMAIKDFKPIQPGDVPATASDSSALRQWIDYSPQTPITYGVAKFVQWYLKYYLNR